MELALIVFRIGVGIGALLVGIGLLLAVVSLRGLARDVRALARDTARLTRVLDKELPELIERAREATVEKPPPGRLDEGSVQSPDAEENEAIA